MQKNYDKNICIEIYSDGVKTDVKSVVYLCICIFVFYVFLSALRGATQYGWCQNRRKIGGDRNARPAQKAFHRQVGRAGDYGGFQKYYCLFEKYTLEIYMIRIKRCSMNSEEKNVLECCAMPRVCDPKLTFYHSLHFHCLGFAFQ